MSIAFLQRCSSTVPPRCYNPKSEKDIVPVRAIYLLMLALLGSVSVVKAAPLPQATSISLDTYRQLVNEAYAAAQRSDRIGLDESAEKLLAASGVELSNEDIV